MTISLPPLTARNTLVVSQSPPLFFYLQFAESCQRGATLTPCGDFSICSSAGLGLSRSRFLIHDPNCFPSFCAHGPFLEPLPLFSNSNDFVVFLSNPSFFCPWFLVLGVLSPNQKLTNLPTQQLYFGFFLFFLFSAGSECLVFPDPAPLPPSFVEARPQ